MSKSLAATYPLAQPPAAIAAALRSAQFARVRLAAADRDDPQLLSHEVDADRIRVSWSSYTPLRTMPSWMHARYRTQGPQAIRHEEWVWDGSSLQGSFVQENADAGGKIVGRQWIDGAGEGSTWHVDMESTYPVAIIGSKIEKFSLDSMNEAFLAEATAFEQAS